MPGELVPCPGQPPRVQLVGKNPSGTASNGASSPQQNGMVTVVLGWLSWCSYRYIRCIFQVRCRRKKKVTCFYWFKDTSWKYTVFLKCEWSEQLLKESVLSSFNKQRHLQCGFPTAAVFRFHWLIWPNRRACIHSLTCQNTCINCTVILKVEENTSYSNF